MEGYKRINQDVQEARQYEQMVADNKQLKADLIYIAMMADIDLDEDEAAEEEE